MTKINTKFDADAWLKKELAEKAAVEAKEVVSPAAAAKEAAWLLGYAKKKPIKNFVGNFWGFNRNRCSIIKPGRSRRPREPRLALEAAERRGEDIPQPAG